MPSSPASSAASTGGSAPIVWLNGALLDASEAGISPFDHGLLTGDGVFETLAGLGGEPFAASRHHQRLVRSAAALGLIPPPAEELLTAMREVMHANGCLDARIRVTVTGEFPRLARTVGRPVTPRWWRSRRCRPSSRSPTWSRCHSPGMKKERSWD
ncbi:MAG: aminotransferase class IV [Verrucomicrobiales bacterium]